MHKAGTCCCVEGGGNGYLRFFVFGLTTKYKALWRALRRFECKELTDEQVAEAGVDGVLENVEHDCVHSRVIEAKLPIHFHDVPIVCRRRGEGRRDGEMYIFLY